MFTGFTPETIDFLWGIRMNNNREWFLEHKSQYTSTLYEPMKALGQELFQPFLSRSGDVLKVSRIYRDARRLHGRGPYKDHLWWCIRTGAEDWVSRPTFWFEIGPDYYSYGLGFWAPKAAFMEAYRREMDRDPKGFARLVRRFEKREDLELKGEDYKKPRQAPAPELAPWYQKKNLMLCREGPLDEGIFSPALADRVLAAFRELMPLYRWLTRVAAAVPQGEKCDKEERP